MRYPSFPKRGDLIGICAPSAGVGGKLESFDRSLAVLRAQGYRVGETQSVRLDDQRGGSAEQRGHELNELFADPEVRAVLAASGGDFLDEMLPYADFELMKNHPKWMMGASDPTGLLFPYTTLCDVATLYGSNAGSFDLLKEPEENDPGDAGETVPPGSAADMNRTGERKPGGQRRAVEEGRFLQDALSCLRGEIPVQESSRKHLGCAPFLADEIRFDTPTVWKGTEERLHVSGRCIGGCIDVLKDLIGTPYDGADTFVRRYGARDGVIWYFDNFALSAEMLYRTFLQMDYAGWFRNTRLILVGRTLFEKSESGMTYDEAAARAFGGRIPIIWDADIGHTVPHMTMVNGAMLDVSYDQGRAGLKFSLT